MLKKKYIAPAISCMLVIISTNTLAAATNQVVDNIKNQISDTLAKQANDLIRNLEESILQNTDFTHIEINVGQDTFNLSSNKTKNKVELTSVYRLHEDDNKFIFNQASLVDFNDRKTLNLGLGIRHINDDETIIYGANIFYDYERDSKHKRSGIGAEYITSLGEIRVNKYKAISGTLAYKGVNEEALDGHDIRLSYNLPVLYSSSLFYNEGSWKDGKSYKTDTKEWGVKGELLPNLHLSVSSQKKDNTNKTTVSSLSYAIPFGKNASQKIMQNGEFTSKLKNIRSALYKPVKRENRIMKKSISLGVVASGY